MAKIKIGITIGDPSGVGPEITVRALSQIGSIADFFVIGDAWLLKKISKNIAGIRKNKIIDLNNLNHFKFSFGKVSPEYGKASIEYLDKAMQLIRNNKIDALVNCPISKESVNLAGYHYSGHTEYLMKKTDTKHAVMMLLNKYLKFSLVTRHLPLKKVSDNLNPKKIARDIQITNRDLMRFFGVKQPKIVVCGLNPHASDNGLIGDEENKILKPILAKIKKKIKVFGPLPADIAVYKAMKKEFDAVIAMYHDQALIPLKLTSPESGVNITLGLPFVRTSVLHGTAFDIAGKSKASPASLIASIRLAIQCTQNLKKA